MGKLYVGNVLRDTVGQLKIGNTDVLKGYVGDVLVFPQPTTTTTTTTTSTTTTTTTLSTTTSTTTTTTTIVPTTTTTTTTSTTTTTTTAVVAVNFTIAAGACSGGPGTGTITISAYTGGGGLYQITTTTYTSASNALGGTFADDVAPNTYTSVPNGTRFVAVRDKITPANVTAKSVAINCTTTTTTTTSTTTTTTTTIASVNHFRSATPQINSTNACAQSTPTSIFTSVPDDTMSVGITFYINSGLTTTFNGASQWFKILWKGAIGFNDIYFVQINNVGIVQNYGFCSSITTTTTTTTTTTSTTTTTTTAAPTTSTTTTTTTVAALTTSTTTTTTTAAISFNHLRSVTPQSNSANACAQSTPTTIYGKLTEPNMAIGITLYTNPGVTTTFNGSSQWFRIIWKGDIGFNDNYGVQISSVGVVQNWVYCPA